MVPLQLLFHFRYQIFLLFLHFFLTQLKNIFPVFLVGEFEYPMNKVANAVQKFSITFLSEIVPVEITVEVLRSNSQQVVSPVLNWNSCINALVSKNPYIF